MPPIGPRKNLFLSVEKAQQAAASAWEAKWNSNADAANNAGSKGSKGDKYAEAADKAAQDIGNQLLNNLMGTVQDIR